MDLFDALIPVRESAPLREASWNPSDHPRDPIGRFASVLGDLKTGGSVSLPDGIRVQRTSSGFRIHKPGTDKPVIEATPGQAAAGALGASARSTHPRSIGGTHSYTSATAAARSAGPPPKAPAPNPNASRLAAGRHSPKAVARRAWRTRGVRTQ